MRSFNDMMFINLDFKTLKIEQQESISQIQRVSCWFDYLEQKSFPNYHTQNVIANSWLGLNQQIDDSNKVLDEMKFELYKMNPWRDLKY